jgi:acetyl coenzyme A synthetase (ADP forming)-like protein
MQKFFTPKTIAVIGVSKDPNKIGSVIFNNLYKHFRTFPINLHEMSIYGERCYASVKNIPEPVDLAIIAIPSQFVLKAVKECGEKKIKNIVIISSGFKETGNIKLEKELFLLLKKYNIKCVGPNCLGLLDSHSGLDCLFLPQKKLSRPKHGSISFVSQSGALGAAILDMLASDDFGLAKFISYGNATNLSETDYLEYLDKDPQTKVICLYVEGIMNGKKFIDTAKKINKPIIVIKGGRFSYSAKAAMSHTGSMAGSYDIYKGAFKQSNLIIADSIEEMFDIAKLFDKLQHVNGKKIQVITNGGGFGVLTIDAIEENGLPLAELSEDSKKSLKSIMPKNVAVSNPLDLVGDADNDRYDLALNACIADKKVDIIMVIILPQTPKINTGIVGVIKKYYGKRPIIAISVGGKEAHDLYCSLERENIPVFFSPSDAVRALKKFLR